MNRVIEFVFCWRERKFSKSPGYIRKIPLNPSLQKWEAVGMPELLIVTREHRKISLSSQRKRSHNINDFQVGLREMPVTEGLSLEAIEPFKSNGRLSLTSKSICLYATANE